MSSETFYADLPYFSEFSGVSELDRYHPLPDDWTVLATDVVRSTQAIENGKYKQVNMVGAASIICVLNAYGNAQLPFVFGGDGGMIAVPPGVQPDAIRELEHYIKGEPQDWEITREAAAKLA